MTTNERRRPSGCYWVLLIFVGVGLAISMAVNLGLMTALATKASVFGKRDGEVAQDEYPEFSEQWSYGDGDVVVARIPLTGIIMREAPGSFFMPVVDPVQLVLDQIRAAQNDETVRAILLEVDSPGGAVTPSDEIYHALLGFRASDEERRVIVFARDVAASGAYYAAVASDWIIAEPTSILGSIGVIMQTLNWHQLSERMGVSDVTIKSGENKDMLNPFRTPDLAELGILQNVVDSMHRRFSDAVKEGRGLDDAAMERIADGRIFTTEDAMAEGMIDEIGYWDDAVAATARVLDVPSVRIIRYEQHRDFFSLLASMRAPLMPWQSTAFDRPRLLYLWRP